MRTDKALFERRSTVTTDKALFERGSTVRMDKALFERGSTAGRKEELHSLLQGSTAV